MTISTTTRTAGPFPGTGVIGAIPFAFKTLLATDLAVTRISAAGVLSTLVLITDYAVSLNADQDVSPGGTVTPVVALEVGATLSITTAAAATQGASLTNLGGFFPKVIEGALDRLTILIQQILTGASRLTGVLQYPVGDLASAAIPAAANRASKLLGFDASGNVAVVTPNSQDAAALALLLASWSGSAQVGHIAAGTGSVTRTMQAKGREVISVQDKGVYPGPAFAVTNCAAYKRLIADVRTIGRDVLITWPAGQGAYYFSPKDDPTYSGGAAYLWRFDVELVDVVNIYHQMPGVTIYHRADAGWYRGNSTPVAGLDEGVIQFRATTAGGCKRVGIVGPCTIKTDDTLDDLTTGHSDGTSFGVAYRGCQETITAYVTTEYWGTDGIYFGPGYSNTPEGSQHILVEPVCYRNHRQGISVVANSHGRIYGGYLHETGGGSFGHGIDFEPNGSMTQKDWRLFGTRTRNNQRGACNFINTSDVTWFAPDIDEQATATSGTVYCEGSNVVGYTVENIRFIGGRVQGSQAILYIPVGVVAQGGIDNIEFIDCDCAALADALNSNACIRVNPTGAVGRQLGRFKFKGGTISGNGGVTLKGDGTTQASITFDDVDWHLTNPNGSTVKFTWGGEASADVHLHRVRMTVDSTKTMTTITPTIPRGTIYDCDFSSHSGAVIEWRDWTVGWTTEIGFNRFSDYSYYDGCVTALDIKFPGAVQETRSGDFGIPYRTMNGGRQRVVQYLASPGSFTGNQAPQDGDMVINAGNSATGIAAARYIYESTTAAWRQIGHIVKKNTTANRPSMISADVGVQYLDTTLDADGKPIWYTGTAWVDATGAVV